MSSDCCPECGSSVVTDDTRGELTCTSCGLVVESSLVELGKDWRAYNATEEKDRARVGAPVTPLETERGTSSTGLRHLRDASGDYLDPKRRFDFQRLANLDRTRSSEIRNLRRAFRELQRLTSDLGIGTSVTQLASMVYRKALKADLIRGRSIDCIVASSLYIACRKQGVPISLKDIQERGNATPKEISRAVRTLIAVLNIRPQNSSPLAFVQKLATNLNMTMHTTQRAFVIVTQAQEAGITMGKNPMSVAAAALYVAGVQTGERRTQHQLAAAAKTTPVTIRNRFKELMDALEGFEDVEIKRGAAAVPQYIEDPLFFAKQS